MNRKLKSSFFCLLTAIIWGFAFVAQVDSADKITPFLYNGTRFVLGAAALLPVIFLFENKNEKNQSKKISTKDTVKYGIICGAILFVASIFQQIGINLQPNAGKAGFITSVYTVLVPIFCFILFRKKSNWNVWLGALLATVGLYLLCVKNGFGSISQSDLVIFTGAIFWAFHIIAIDRFISKVSPIKFSAIQFLTCGILGLILSFIFERNTLTEIIIQYKDAYISILYAGIMSSGLAYTFQALGQRDSDPTVAAILLSCESIFAAVGGLIFRTDEVLDVTSYIGCAIIFAAIIISQFEFKSIKK